MKLMRMLWGVTVFSAGAAVTYRVFLRKLCLTWGARPDEIDRQLPGDELLPEADVVATRAISIDAPPSAIWPWLVQMGCGRGGAYTYDWVENLLGLDMHSADDILPQFQNLRQGDLLPLRRGEPQLRVEILEPERTLTLRREDGTWVWTFSLASEGQSTRLVSRNRISTPGASVFARTFTPLVLEPGSLVMERKMLFGIKERAERASVAVVSVATAHTPT